MATIVVTGAAGGLGLELVRCYRQRGDEVWGATRRPDRAADLAAVCDHVIELDPGSPESIERGAAALGDRPVDLLVNNAGVNAGAFGVPEDRRSVLDISPEHFLDEVRINTVGPMLVMRALLPNLRAAARPVVLNISSQVGSMVVGAAIGRDVGYQASKSALNMVTVKAAGALAADGVVVVAMHPGWVRTSMGGPKADLEPADAAARIAATVDGLTMERTGSFIRWDGTTHPW